MKIVKLFLTGVAFSLALIGTMSDTPPYPHAANRLGIVTSSAGGDASVSTDYKKRITATSPAV
jgi:hypothetical protein